MRATMDLLALYRYDKTLFDRFVVPDELDKNLLIDNLLMESAEREIVYSSFDFMKAAIGSWSAKMLHVWQELYATTQYEYNPIWNKDGIIKEKITRDLHATEDVKDHTKTVNDLKEERDLKQTNDLHSTNDVKTKDNVFGYNSSSEAPASSQTIDQDGSNTGSIKNSGDIRNTGSVDNNRDLDRDTSDTGTIETERIESGNIGVTTTQQMIREQREVVKLNLYDVIISDFIDRFCLKVY